MSAEKQPFMVNDFRWCFSKNISRVYFTTDVAYGCFPQSLNNQSVRNYLVNAIMWFLLRDLDPSSFSAGFFSTNLPSQIFFRQGFAVFSKPVKLEPTLFGRNTTSVKFARKTLPDLEFTIYEWHQTIKFLIRKNILSPGVGKNYKNLCTMSAEKQPFLLNDFRWFFATNISRVYLTTDVAYGCFPQSLNNQSVRNYSVNASIWFLLGDLDRSSFSAGFFSINLPIRHIFSPWFGSVFYAGKIRADTFRSKDNLG